MFEWVKCVIIVIGFVVRVRVGRIICKGFVYVVVGKIFKLIESCWINNVVIIKFGIDNLIIVMFIVM